jgi:hypothetical protein
MEKAHCLRTALTWHDDILTAVERADYDVFSPARPCR